MGAIYQLQRFAIRTQAAMIPRHNVRINFPVSFGNFLAGMPMLWWGWLQLSDANTMFASNRPSRRLPATKSLPKLLVSRLWHCAKPTGQHAHFW